MDKIKLYTQHGEGETINHRVADFGAISKEEYLKWQQSSCGIACVRMVLSILSSSPPPIYDLIRLANDEDYLPRIGWTHGFLVRLLKQWGVDAVIGKELTLDKLIEITSNPKQGVILSIKNRLPVSNGHLVVLFRTQGSQDFTMLDPYTLDGKGGRVEVAKDLLAEISNHKGVIFKVTK